MFDVVLLRSLLAVADAGGFTRAAAQLHLTQSAISAHIRRLEGEVGHKLLQRTTRSVALTPAGTKLAGYARSILALNADARASLGLGSPLAGAVRVGASEEMAKAPLAECLRRFAPLHRRVHITLIIGLTNELLVRLEAGELDLVLGSQCGASRNAEILWSEPLVWAAAPIHKAVHATTMPVPLAVFPDSCPYRAAAIESLARAGCEWRIVCESASAEGLLVAAATGLAVVPMTRSNCLSAGLEELTTLPKLPDAQFILVPGFKSHPVVEALMQELRRCAAGGGQ